MLTSIDTEMPGNVRGDRCERTLELTLTWEGEESQSLRRIDSVGLPVMPLVARSGNGDKREKTEDLGCGVCQTD